VGLGTEVHSRDDLRAGGIFNRAGFAMRFRAVHRDAAKAANVFSWYAHSRTADPPSLRAMAPSPTPPPGGGAEGHACLVPGGGGVDAGGELEVAEHEGDEGVPDPLRAPDPELLPRRRVHLKGGDKHRGAWTKVNRKGRNIFRRSNMAMEFRKYAKK